MAEFDKFAQNYTNDLAKDLGSFGKYKDTAFLYKSQYLKYVLPEEPSGILDFGCGVGSNIPYLKKYFPNAKLFGCDVSSESIKIAEDNYQYCEFSIINTPEELKQYKGNINVVFISTVLHHYRAIFMVHPTRCAILCVREKNDKKQQQGGLIYG